MREMPFKRVGVSMEQMSIFDYPEYMSDKKTPSEVWANKTGFNDYWQHEIKFVDDNPVCKYSGHTCNRKELWKVAESFEDITCMKTCCRQCHVRLCGARCNGSTEPTTRKGIIWHYSLTAVYTECPYCHSQNTEDERTGECKVCHEVMDLMNIVEKKSKDYIECEKLELSGGVYKDDKGQWKERFIK